MFYLTKILEEKKREIDRLKGEQPMRRYMEQQSFFAPCRDFAGAIMGSGGGVKLIAEIKKASPSRGLIVSDFDPIALAERYRVLGASAYSVLTDRIFFQGSSDYLQMVSGSFPLPVLRKDFIIDESQIFQSRLIGADAILLIVAALDSFQLSDYLQVAAGIGLHVLVEVHDREELDRAIDAGVAMIGVNNRNLRDFSVDLQTSVTLRPFIPPDIIAIAESGLKTAADIVLIQQALFDAVLIGEGLHTSQELSQFTWSNS
ncbi:MAG: indole-3-glycerol phosphate synthase TrpC [Chlorobiaceae bacterium]